LENGIKTEVVDVSDLTKKRVTALTKSARRTWDEAFGDQIEGKKNWQKAFWASMAVTLLAVGGCIYESKQPKQIAYVMKVDSGGHVVSAGPLAEQPVTQDTWDSIYDGAIRAEVERWRSVTSDKTFRDANYDETFNHLADNSQAYHFMYDWFSQNDPAARAANGDVVTVSIDYSERVGQYSYNVQWTESTHSGQTVATHKWHSRMTFIPLAKDPTKIKITEVTLEQLHDAQSNN
jgi:type IV secretory pathway TrbF-like protein